MNFKSIRGAILSATAALLVVAPVLKAAETEAQRDERMAWFRDARFGMFIHWGLYAIPGGEWNGETKHAEWIRHTAKIPLEEYEKLVPQFNPTNFDANAWARLARRAGMRYLVITSKHHDGFCLWDSKLTDFDVMSTPFKRDVLKELRNACDRQGVRFATYHSIMDWHHPDYLPRRDWERASRPVDGADFERYRAYLRGQLRELRRGYRPAILWFDGEWENTWTHEMGIGLYDYVLGLDPEIIINNRVDKGRSGMQGMNKEGDFRGDFGTPEQEIPAKGLPGVDWESCMTMNDHWGWNKSDKNWKSTEDLIRKLIDIASKGGNFLLNVGPKPDGTFPDEAIERLEGIGQWMAKNSESIYGTKASPFQQLPWGRCTRKTVRHTTTLYLHVFDWPKNGQLLVPGLRNTTGQAYTLADKRVLSVGYSPEGLTISVPEQAPDSVSSTVVLKLHGEPQIDDAATVLVIKQAADGTFLLPAASAQFQGEMIRFEHGENRNCIGFWMNPSDTASWDIQVSKAGKYEITAEHAGPQPTSIQFNAVEGDVTATLPATGDYGKFTTTVVGTIEIPSGKTTLQATPVREGWQAVNLRSVVLRPVK